MPRDWSLCSGALGVFTSSSTLRLGQQRGLHHSASNRPRSSERTLHQGVEEGTAFWSHGIPLDERGLQGWGETLSRCLAQYRVLYGTEPAADWWGWIFFTPSWTTLGDQAPLKHRSLKTCSQGQKTEHQAAAFTLWNILKQWKVSWNIVKHLETRTCSDSEVSGWVTQQFGYFDLATFFNIIFIVPLSTKIWCLKLCFVSETSCHHNLQNMVSRRFGTVIQCTVVIHSHCKLQGYSRG